MDKSLNYILCELKAIKRDEETYSIARVNRIRNCIQKRRQNIFKLALDTYNLQPKDLDNMLESQNRIVKQFIKPCKSPLY